MKLKEAYGRKVLSANDAEVVGRVEAFVIDANKGSVVGLRLAKVSGNRSFLSWSDLRGFGADAVIVGGADLLRAPAGEAEERSASKGLQLIGKLVLSESGMALGAVSDVDFDEGSGSLVSFDLGEAGNVVAARLLGAGSYAVVVTDGDSTTANFFDPKTPRHE